MGAQREDQAGYTKKTHGHRAGPWAWTGPICRGVTEMRSDKMGQEEGSSQRSLGAETRVESQAAKIYRIRSH